MLGVQVRTTPNASVPFVVSLADKKLTDQSPSGIQARQTLQADGSVLLEPFAAAPMVAQCANFITGRLYAYSPGKGKRQVDPSGLHVINLENGAQLSSDASPPLQYTPLAMEYDLLSDSILSVVAGYKDPRTGPSNWLSLVAMNTSSPGLVGPVYEYTGYDSLAFGATCLDAVNQVFFSVMERRAGTVPKMLFAVRRNSTLHQLVQQQSNGVPKNWRWFDVDITAPVLRYIWPPEIRAVTQMEFYPSKPKAQIVNETGAIYYVDGDPSQQSLFVLCTVATPVPLPGSPAPDAATLAAQTQACATRRCGAPLSEDEGGPATCTCEPAVVRLDIDMTSQATAPQALSYDLLVRLNAVTSSLRPKSSLLAFISSISATFDRNPSRLFFMDYEAQGRQSRLFELGVEGQSAQAPLVPNQLPLGSYQVVSSTSVGAPWTFMLYTGMYSEALKSPAARVFPIPTSTALSYAEAPSLGLKYSGGNVTVTAGQAPPATLTVVAINKFGLPQPEDNFPYENLTVTISGPGWASGNVAGLPLGDVVLGPTWGQPGVVRDAPSAARFLQGPSYVAGSRGRYLATFSVEHAGKYQIRVTNKADLPGNSTGGDIRGSPYTLLVVPGTTRGLWTTVEAGNVTLDSANAAARVGVVVGDVSQLAIQARDRYGNPVGKGGDEIKVSFQSEGGRVECSLPPLASATSAARDPQGKTPWCWLADLGSGRYNLSFYLTARSISAPTVQLAVTVNDEKVFGSPPFTLDLKQTFADANVSVALAANGEPLTALSIIAGEIGAFTVQTKDRFGNQQSQGGDAFTLLVRDTSGRAAINGSVARNSSASGAAPAVFARDVLALWTDLGTGLYSAGYSFVTAGGNASLLVSLAGKPISGMPIPVTVAAAATEPSNCIAYGPGLYNLTAGTLDVSFTLALRDRYNNSRGSVEDLYQQQPPSVSFSYVLEQRLLPRVAGNLGSALAGSLLLTERPFASSDYSALSMTTDIKFTVTSSAAAAGTFTVSYGTTLAGRVNVSVSMLEADAVHTSYIRGADGAAGSNGPTSSPFAVRVFPASPSVAQSELLWWGADGTLFSSQEQRGLALYSAGRPVANPLVAMSAVAGREGVFFVQRRDVYANLLRDPGVPFSVSVAGLGLDGSYYRVPVRVVYMGNAANSAAPYGGLYMVTFTSLVAGPMSVRVLAGSDAAASRRRRHLLQSAELLSTDQITAPDGSLYTVQVLAADISASMSGVTGAGLRGVLVRTPLVFFIVARDYLGNEAATDSSDAAATAQWTVNIRHCPSGSEASCERANMTGVAVSAAGPGRWRVEYTPTISETFYAIYVYFRGTLITGPSASNIKLPKFVPVKLQVGDPSLGFSTIDPAVSSGTAGEVLSLQLAARNGIGMDIRTCCAFDIVSVYATTGPKFPGKNQFFPQPGALNLTEHVVDNNDGTYNITFPAVPPSGVVPWGGLPLAGQMLVVVRAHVRGTSGLDVKDVGTQLDPTAEVVSPFAVTLSPGPTAASTSTLQISADPTSSPSGRMYTFVSGTTPAISIIARDRLGNAQVWTPVLGGDNWDVQMLRDGTGTGISGRALDNQDGTYRVTLNVTTAADYRLTVSLLPTYATFGTVGEPISGGDRVYIRVVPGPVSIASCQVSGPPNWDSPTAGSSSLFWVQEMDASGNARSERGTFPGSSAALQFTVVITRALNVSDTRSLSATWNPSSALHELRWQPVVAGAYTVRVAAGTTAVPQNITLTVKPGPLSVAQSLAWGKGVRIDNLSPGTARAGEVVPITISARDSFGNALTSGGEAWQLSVTSVDPQQPSSAQVDVVDYLNGTYQASYYVVHARRFRVQLSRGGEFLPTRRYAAADDGADGGSVQGSSDASKPGVEVLILPGALNATTSFPAGAVFVGSRAMEAGSDLAFSVVGRDLFLMNKTDTDSNRYLRAVLAFLGGSGEKPFTGSAANGWSNTAGVWTAVIPLVRSAPWPAQYDGRETLGVTGNYSLSVTLVTLADDLQTVASEEHIGDAAAGSQSPFPFRVQPSVSSPAFTSIGGGGDAQAPTANTTAGVQDPLLAAPDVAAPPPPPPLLQTSQPSILDLFPPPPTSPLATNSAPIPSAPAPASRRRMQRRLTQSPPSASSHALVVTTRAGGRGTMQIMLSDAQGNVQMVTQMGIARPHERLTVRLGEALFPGTEACAEDSVVIYQLPSGASSNCTMVHRQYPRALPPEAYALQVVHLFSPGQPQGFAISWTLGADFPAARVPYALEILLFDTPIQGSPAALVVEPGPISAKHCLLFGSGLRTGRAGQPSSFTITARDQFDNLQLTSPEATAFSVRMLLALDSAALGSTFVVTGCFPASTQCTFAISVEGATAGDYVVTYTAPLPGVYRTSVAYLNQEVPNPWAQNGTALLPGNTSAPACTASGAGLIGGPVGARLNFTIFARDESGSLQLYAAAGPDSFEVVVVSPGDGSAPAILVTPQDNGDGTYTATWTPKVAGTHTLRVTLNAIHIQGSPFSPVIRLADGVLSARSTRLVDVAGRVLAGIRPLTAGEATTLLLQAGTLSGDLESPKATGGDSVRARITGSISGAALNLSVPVTDLRNGRYSMQVNLTVASEYMLYVEVCPGSPCTLGLWPAARGSPFVLEVLPGALDPAASFARGLSGATLTRWQAGALATFKIQAVDAFGNFRQSSEPAGAAGFEVAIRGLEDGVTSAQIGSASRAIADADYALQDRADGTYEVRFNRTHAQELLIALSYQGVPLQGSPVLAAIVPGPVSIPNSVVASAADAWTVGEQLSVVVRARDMFGNYLADGGTAFRAYLTLSELIPGAGGSGDNPLACRGAVPGSSSAAQAFDQASQFRFADGKVLTCAVQVMDLATGAYVVTLHSERAGGAVLAIVAPVAVGLATEELAICATPSAQALCDAVPGLRVNPDDSSLAVRFAASVPDPAECSTSARGAALTSATAGVPAVFSIRARDSFRNDISRGGYSFSVTLASANESEFLRVLGSAAFVAEDVRDAGGALLVAGGLYRASYTATRAGLYTLRVRRNRRDLGGSPFKNLQVVPGNTAGSSSVLQHPTDSALDPTSGAKVRMLAAVAGSVTRLTLVTYDAFGNRRTTGGESIAISIGQLIRAATVDNQDGTYTGTYNISVAGLYRLQVLVTGETVRQPAELFRAEPGSATGGYFPLSVAPSTPVAANSRASGPGLAAALAGTPATITVTARDFFNNIAVRGGEAFQAIFTGPPDSPPVTFNSSDNGDGTYAITYMHARAGVYSLDIVSARSGFAIAGSPWKALAVAPGAVDPKSCSCSGVGVAAAGVTAQTAAAFVVVMRDALGNNVTAVDSSLFVVKVESTRGWSGMRSRIEVATTVKLRSFSPPPAQLPFATSGTVYYDVAYRTPYAGLHWVSVTVMGRQVAGSPFAVRVAAAAASAADSKLWGRALSPCLVGTPTTAVLLARDVLGNPRGVGGDSVSATLTAPGGGDGAAQALPVVDNGDGTYAVTFTASLPGKHSLAIQLAGGVATGAPLDVVAYKLVGNKGQASAADSFAIGEGLAAATVGVNATFTVFAQTGQVVVQDDAGHDSMLRNFSLATGGEASGFKVQLTCPDAGVTDGTVVDNGDGTYTVTYVSPVGGKQCRLAVKYGGAPLRGSPFSVFSFPGATSGSSSVVDWRAQGLMAALAGLESVADSLPPPANAVAMADLSAATSGPALRLSAGSSAIFRIYSVDALGNRQMGSQSAPPKLADTLFDAWEVVVQPVEAALSPVAALRLARSVVTTELGDGSYAATFRPVLAGLYNVSVSLQGAMLGSVQAAVDPGPMSVLQTSVTGMDGSSSLADVIASAQALTPLRFLIRGRDAYGNALTAGGERAKLDVQVVAPGTSAVTELAVADTGDGNYTASFVPPVTGVYAVRVSVSGVLLRDPSGASSQATGSGAIVAVAADPQHCAVVGSGAALTTSGAPASFVIQAGDRTGAAKAVGGDRFRVLARGRGPPFPPVNEYGIALPNVTASVVDQAELVAQGKPGTPGLYTVSYSMDVFGSYLLDVELWQASLQLWAPIGGSPLNLTVLKVPAPTSCLLRKPRCVREGIFSKSGTAITVEFDSDTDGAGLTGLNDCSLVFAEATAARLGQGALCGFPRADALTAYLGPGALVLPNEALLLRGDALRNAARTSEYAQLSPVAERPLAPPQPVPVLRAPVRLGVCDNFTLDASGSYGKAGRDPTFVFGVHPTAPNSSAIAQLLRTATGAAFEVPAESLAVNASYTFDVLVQNFFGEVASTSHTVVRYSWPLPRVVVEGPALLSVARGEDARITAAVALSSCWKDSPELSFVWETEVGSPFVELDAQTRNTRTLFIPAGSLAAGVLYRLVVTASVPGQPQLSNSAVASVRVKFSPIVAALEGPSMSTTGAVLLLDASRSSDPDDPSPDMPLEPFGEFLFTWSCAKAGGGACFEDTRGLLQGDPSEPQLLIPAGVLAPGLYDFTMQVRKEPLEDGDGLIAGRVKSVVKRVEVLAGEGGRPSIIISALNSSAVNANEPLRLEARLLNCGVPSACAGLRFNWSVLEGQLDLGAYPAQLLTPRSSLNLAVRPGALSPGQDCRLRVTASDDNGTAVSWDDVAFHVNAPPTSGTFDVSPLSGQALQDEFTLSCQGWEDDSGQPLLYQFRYQDPASGALVPLIAQSRDNSAQVTLPAVMLRASDYAVTLLAVMQDNAGAQTSVNRTVTLLPPQVLDPSSGQNVLLLLGFDAPGDGNATTASLATPVLLQNQNNSYLEAGYALPVPSASRSVVAGILSRKRAQLPSATLPRASWAQLLGGGGDGAAPTPAPTPAPAPAPQAQSPEPSPLCRFLWELMDARLARALGIGDVPQVLTVCRSVGKLNQHAAETRKASSAAAGGAAPAAAPSSPAPAPAAPPPADASTAAQAAQAARDATCACEQASVCLEALSLVIAQVRMSQADLEMVSGSMREISSLGDCLKADGDSTASVASSLAALAQSALSTGVTAAAAQSLLASAGSLATAVSSLPGASRRLRRHLLAVRTGEEGEGGEEGAEGAGLSAREWQHGRHLLQAIQEQNAQVSEIATTVARAGLVGSLAGEDPFSAASANLQLAAKRSADTQGSFRVPPAPGMAPDSAPAFELPSLPTSGASAVDVVALVSAVNPFPSAAKIAGAVAGLDILPAGGSEPLEVRGLLAPVRIRLPLEVSGCSCRVTEGQCRYWDAERAEWSTEGLFVAETGPDYVVCETIHLSTFGVSADDVVPKFNLVDPIGDADLFSHINTSNMGALLMLGGIYVVYALANGVGYWKDVQERSRESLAAKISQVKARLARSQGAESEFTDLAALGIPADLTHKGRGAQGGPKDLGERVSAALLEEHVVGQILAVTPDDPYTRPQRLTVLLCIILGNIALSAVFFGTNPSNVAAKVLTGVICAVAMLPSKVLFQIIFKKATYKPPPVKRKGPPLPLALEAPPKLPAALAHLRDPSLIVEESLREKVTKMLAAEASRASPVPMAAPPPPPPRLAVPPLRLPSIETPPASIPGPSPPPPPPPEWPSAPAAAASAATRWHQSLEVCNHRRPLPPPRLSGASHVHAAGRPPRSCEDCTCPATHLCWQPPHPGSCVPLSSTSCLRALASPPAATLALEDEGHSWDGRKNR